MNGIFSRPVDARDLLDQVDLPVTSRMRQVGTGTSQPGATSKPSARGCPSAPARRSRCRRSGWRGRSGRRPPAARGARRRRRHVARPAGAGELDHELGREPGGVRREVGVDALLPAVRALGAKRVALGAPEDRAGLEVGGLEEDGGRLLGHLRVEPAHDPGEGDRALAVGDDEVGRVELAQVAVEARELLARPRAPDDDPAARERVEVEGVQRVPEREHDVVRHVDDVRDRAHPGSGEARLHPRRRLADPHVPEEAAHVARAALEVLDGDVRRLVAGRLGVVARHRPQLAPEERRRPHARSRRPRGSRAGCASPRSPAPPRRAGGRRRAACPAPTAPGGRGCPRARR